MYHPQSDGLTERWNRTLLGMLATCVEDRTENWEDYVQKVCMAYNTSTYATTGFTPFFLMFRRQVRIPADLMYGTAEPESHDYRIAREYSAGKQERQIIRKYMATLMKLGL